MEEKLNDEIEPVFCGCSCVLFQRFVHSVVDENEREDKVRLHSEQHLLPHLHENRVGRVARKLEKPTCEYEAVVANAEDRKLFYGVLELERIRFGTAAGNGVWIRTIPAWTVAGIGVWIRTIRAWTVAGIGVWIGTIWAKIIIIRTVRLIVYLRTATVVRIPCAAIWTHILRTI